MNLEMLHAISNTANVTNFPGSQFSRDPFSTNYFNNLALSGNISTSNVLNLGPNTEQNFIDTLTGNEGQND